MHVTNSIFSLSRSFMLSYLSPLQVLLPLELWSLDQCLQATYCPKILLKTHYYYHYYPSIRPLSLLFRGAGNNPRWHWVRGGVYPGQTAYHTADYYYYYYYGYISIWKLHCTMFLFLSLSLSTQMIKADGCPPSGSAQGFCFFKGSFSSLMVGIVGSLWIILQRVQSTPVLYEKNAPR